MSIKSFLKNHTLLYLLFRKPYCFFINLPKCVKVAKEDSYFPNLQRKAFCRRLFELFVWFLNNNEVNVFYNLYCLDIKERENIKKYYPYDLFLKKRDLFNKIGNPDSQIVILRDKFLFYKFMKCLGYPVPQVKAVIINNQLFDEKMDDIPENYLLKENNYFVKAIDGECGNSVKHIANFTEFFEYKKQIYNVNCIIQDAVIQHEKMKLLNPEAVNTIRIITVNKNGNVYLFGALIRIGTKLTGEKDNTSQGGVAVGVKDDGFLMEYGFRKPQFGGITYEHPDTHVIFNDFQIPYYKEAVNLCCKVHKNFYNIRSIGWDVAITPEGPVFIEGNDNWEIQSIQAIKHGLRKEIEEAFNE